MIVDWKTGRGEGRFSEVQLAGYALYAARQGWVQEPEEIETELAYLAIPRYVRRRIDRRKLEIAQAFIEKSAANMRSLLIDPAGNLARLEDFAMIDRPRVCRRCNFRRLCFPRRRRAAAALCDRGAGLAQPFRYFARKAVVRAQASLAAASAVAAPGVVDVGERVASALVDLDVDRSCPPPSSRPRRPSPGRGTGPCRRRRSCRAPGP